MYTDTYMKYKPFTTANNRAWVSYICVADFQDHKAELAVLILVQLMNQLSVVSLQQKGHNIELIRKNTQYLNLFYC